MAAHTHVPLRASVLVSDAVIDLFQDHDLPGRGLGQLMGTKDQTDGIDVEFVAKDANLGLGFTMAYCEALVRIDTTPPLPPGGAPAAAPGAAPHFGSPAAPAAQAAPAAPAAAAAPMAPHNLLLGMQATTLFNRANRARRAADDIYEKRRAESRASGGTGGTASETSRLAKAIVGLTGNGTGADLAVEAMDRGAAEARIREAASNGVAMPTLPELQPGPLLLATVAKYTHSTKPIGDDRAQPRWPSHKQLPASKCDNMHETDHSPFAKLAVSKTTAGLAAAARHKNLGVRTMTYRQLTPRNYSVSSSGGGYLYAKATYERLDETIIANGVRYGNEPDTFEDHWGSVDDVIAEESTTADFNIAISAGLEHWKLLNRLRPPGTAAPAKAAAGQTVPATPNKPTEYASPATANRKLRQEAKDEWKTARGLPSSTPVYTGADGQFTTESPTPSKGTKRKGVTPQPAQQRAQYPQYGPPPPHYQPPPPYVYPQMPWAPPVPPGPMPPPPGGLPPPPGVTTKPGMYAKIPGTPGVNNGLSPGNPLNPQTCNDWSKGACNRAACSFKHA